MEQYRLYKNTRLRQTLDLNKENILLHIYYKKYLNQILFLLC